jgi:hypothetical protein
MIYIFVNLSIMESVIALRGKKNFFDNKFFDSTVLIKTFSYLQ